MNAIICHPLPYYGRTVAWCETCQRRRQTLALVETYFGTTYICRACKTIHEDEDARGWMPDPRGPIWDKARPLSVVRKEALRDR